MCRWHIRQGRKLLGKRNEYCRRDSIYSSVPERLMQAQRATLLGLAITVCCLALILTSCGDPIGGTGKSAVFLSVSAPDGSQFSVFADVYDASLPGGVGSDTADVVIQSIYKNQTDPPDTVFADVIIDEYRVTYYRYDGNTNVPEPFVRPLNISVPAGEETELNFVILRADAKLKSPLKELAFGGGEGQIWFNAVVEFFGEDLAGNAVDAKTVITITASDS